MQGAEAAGQGDAGDGCGVGRRPNARTHIAVDGSDSAFGSGATPVAGSAPRCISCAGRIHLFIGVFVPRDDGTPTGSVGQTRCGHRHAPDLTHLGGAHLQQPRQLAHTTIFIQCHTDTTDLEWRRPGPSQALARCPCATCTKACARHIDDIRRLRWGGSHAARRMIPPHVVERREKGHAATRSG